MGSPRCVVPQVTSSRDWMDLGDCWPFCRGGNGVEGGCHPSVRADGGSERLERKMARVTSLAPRHASSARLRAVKVTSVDKQEMPGERHPGLGPVQRELREAEDVHCYVLHEMDQSGREEHCISVLNQNNIMLSLVSREYSAELGMFLSEQVY